MISPGRMIGRAAELLTTARAGLLALTFAALTLCAAWLLRFLAYQAYANFGVAKLFAVPDRFWGLQWMLPLWILCMIVGVWLLFDLRGKTVRYRVGEDRVHAIDTDRLIPSARNRVWLIGLSLLPFAHERYIQQIEDAVTRRGVEVRILVLNPESEVARLRTHSLYKGDRTLPDEIRESIQHFTALGKSIARNHRAASRLFQLGTYSGNASMSAFMVDDELHLGIYVNQCSGMFAPEIDVVRRGQQRELFEVFEKHMESVFDTASFVGFEEAGVA